VKISQKYIAINKEDGSKKIVDASYVRKSLTGNYKDVDIAMTMLKLNGFIQTSFQIFKYETKTEGD